MSDEGITTRITSAQAVLTGPDGFVSFPPEQITVQGGVVVAAVPAEVAVHLVGWPVEVHPVTSHPTAESLLTWLDEVDPGTLTAVMAEIAAQNPADVPVGALALTALGALVRGVAVDQDEECDDGAVS